jgi:hypothetical protein
LAITAHGLELRQGRRGLIAAAAYHEGSMVQRPSPDLQG